MRHVNERLLHICLILMGLLKFLPRHWLKYCIQVCCKNGCSSEDDVVFQYNGKEAYLKLGSLQQYMRHDDVVSDLSPSKFSVQQVHKIAILDIRYASSQKLAIFCLIVLLDC